MGKRFSEPPADGTGELHQGSLQGPKGMGPCNTLSIANIGHCRNREDRSYQVNVRTQVLNSLAFL